MMKKIIPMFVAIVAVAGAGYWYMKHPAPEPSEALVFDTIKKSSETDKASINLEYPYFKDAKDEDQQAINALIDKSVVAIQKDFDQNVKESMPEDDYKSTLTIKNAIIRADDRIVSIRLDIGWYISGAAHPNAYTIVINYDRAQKHEIKLADLFPGKPEYLTTVSTLAIKDLKKQFAEKDIHFEDYAVEGSAPTVENYQNFLIKDEALLIIFDPYQVGPWAIGIQEVTIPFKDLGITI
jgi:hypothetical protein